MILDNENKNLKIHQWIEKYTQDGNFYIVTGYFTIGAIAFLADITHKGIFKFRFILGDILSFEKDSTRVLDLLNDNITIEAALNLNQVAKKAVQFLSANTVETKTLEPNFCHAKLYLFQTFFPDPQKAYFISGSSNLTEAGIGLKQTNNVELNIAGFGAEPQFIELVAWFEHLWKKEQAHKTKTIIDPTNGKKKEIPFKQYLIDEIKYLKFILLIKC